MDVDMSCQTTINPMCWISLSLTPLSLYSLLLLLNLQYTFHLDLNWANIHFNAKMIIASICTSTFLCSYSMAVVVCISSIYISARLFMAPLVNIQSFTYQEKKCIG